MDSHVESFSNMSVQFVGNLYDKVISLDLLEYSTETAGLRFVIFLLIMDNGSY